MKINSYLFSKFGSLVFLLGISLLVNSASADTTSTYTAKVPASKLSSSWGTGTLECNNSDRPEDWYEEKGRCGEDAGINYWNNDLNIYQYLAKVSGEQLNCSDSSTPNTWYKTNGRCGETSGINYWNSELAIKPLATVRNTFNTAYSQNCLNSFGTTNFEVCNDKLLCNSGDEYIDTTTKCEPITSVKNSFNTAYSQNCSNWFSTSNYESCNDQLLCLPGDEYLDNTNLCQSTCVSSNPGCAANTYTGSSCWDGCAWIAGTKSPVCTGSVPVGYTMCSNDNTGLIADLPWLGVGTASTSCTATRKCEYYGGGSGGGGGSGTTYSCTGSIPPGYSMCSSDDTGLSSDLAWLSVGTTSASCTSGRKCEYYGVGATYSCTGSMLAGHTMCAGDDTGLSSDVPLLKVGPNASSCTPGRKCEYYGSSFSCTGSIPSGYTMCSSDDTGLSSSLIWLNVGSDSSSCTPARKCEYYGSGGSGGFSCIDPPPSGAQYCPGDDSGLSADLSWKQVTSCTPGRKCEYTWPTSGCPATPCFREITP